MENLKHTQGEWEIEGNSIFPKGKGYSIAIVSHISIANTKQNPLEETNANTKLISAAPELLEALIEINKMCADACTEDGAKINVGKLAKLSINAIKKATE